MQLHEYQTEDTEESVKWSWKSGIYKDLFQ